MAATFFGEVTELHSRAVWYSDEDDDEDEDENQEGQIDALANKLKSAGIPSHENLRHKIDLQFRQNDPSESLNISTCIISLVSNWQLKNHKIRDTESVLPFGDFGAHGKAFKISILTGTPSIRSEHLLWVLLDSNCPHISGPEVNYFVELLRDKLNSLMNSDSARQILILSQQYSSSDQLEYLTNSTIDDRLVKGRPLACPAIIRNQFESAVFEQSTITRQSATILCLPDPRDFCFDKEKYLGPAIATEIVDMRLNDNSLHKTLIFT